MYSNGSKEAFVATKSWSFDVSSFSDFTGVGFPPPKYLLQISSNVPLSLISLIKSLTCVKSSGLFLSTPNAYSSLVKSTSITLTACCFVWLSLFFASFPLSELPHPHTATAVIITVRPIAINFFIVHPPNMFSIYSSHYTMNGKYFQCLEKRFCPIYQTSFFSYSNDSPRFHFLYKVIFQNRSDFQTAKIIC